MLLVNAVMQFDRTAMECVQWNTLHKNEHQKLSYGLGIRYVTQNPIHHIFFSLKKNQSILLKKGKLDGTIGTHD